LKIKNPLVWVACPGACDTAIRLPKSRMVLQRTDRWEEFPNVDKEVITTYDHKMKTHADLTVFVSEMLYQEEQSQCKEALFLDHGVDFDKFTLVNGNGHMPEDMTNVSRPVVGFFGGIDDHTFDMPFMNQVIDLLPEMSFVFVGKTSIDCSELIDRDNVWMLGQKSYDEIPHYGKTFDVAIMPWRQNRWIEACNPIKLKEYLALGKPVISRPFSELKKYHDVVYEATTAEEFAAAIRQSLVEDDAERISQRQEKVRPFSWDSKAEMILDRLY
jgi:glycosyltransferase involved in cell wall biosynthesis